MDYLFLDNNCLELTRFSCLNFVIEERSCWNSGSFGCSHFLVHIAIQVKKVKKLKILLTKFVTPVWVHLYISKGMRGMCDATGYQWPVDDITVIASWWNIFGMFRISKNGLTYHNKGAYSQGMGDHPPVSRLPALFPEKSSPLLWPIQAHSPQRQRGSGNPHNRRILMLAKWKLETV